MNDELVYRPTTDIVPAVPQPIPVSPETPAGFRLDIVVYDSELTIEDALSDLGEVPDLSYTFDDKPRVIVPDPIEVVVWAKPFRETILLASAVSDEPTLTFEPNRIGIRNLDLSEVSMVDEVLIPTDIRANREVGADWKKCITIKASDVLKFLPRLGKKDAHEPMRFVVNGNRLTFEFKNMTLEATGYKPEDRELPLPKITHTIEATIPVKDVLDFIDRAKGTTDRIEFSVASPDGPALSATGHVLLTARSEEDRKMTARIEGDVKGDGASAIYDIGRLDLLFKTAKKVSSFAKVKWAKDVPMTIEPIIEDGHLGAVFFLASLMES